MKIELVSFGALTIEGKHYTNDIVIKKGEIKKRNKKASKAYRDQYNHTPLSAEEDIPWKGSKLLAMSALSVGHEFVAPRA